MTDPRAPGLTLAKVTDTVDPDGRGRIKVTFIANGLPSDWIPIMSPFAGSGRGAFFLPKSDDLALVAFCDADPNQPYVLGFLWNGELKPPIEKAKQQDVRVIRTQKGKIIILDDSEEGELTLIDEKSNTIRIDTAKDAITITCKGDLTISGKTVKIETSDHAVSATFSGGAMNLKASGRMALSAATIDLN